VYVGIADRFVFWSLSQYFQSIVFWKVVLFCLPGGRIKYPFVSKVTESLKPYSWFSWEFTFRISMNLETDMEGSFKDVFTR
jgi:hypothetical protein